MKHRVRTGALALAVALGTALPLAGTATAQPDPELPKITDGATESARDISPDDDANHGGREGHLPPRRENVELVGKGAVDDRAPGVVADVDVYGKYAYLARFNGGECDRGGVYVFDISDRSNPQQVNFIPTGEGAYVGEGVQVKRLETSAHTGAVLLFNNELCALSDTAVGGATLVDVRNPLKPKLLANFGDMDPEGVAPGIAHQVHSALMWQHRGKAYAALVDDEEAEDLDIFDITDPRNPRMIAEYDLAAEFPQILQEGLGLDSVFLHDIEIRRNKNRMVMIASNWDAGLVKFDITDPRNIKYYGDTDFTNPDPELLKQTGTVNEPEGNGHQAEFTKDHDLVIQTDEDFNPTGARGQTDDGTSFEAGQGSDSEPIASGDSLSGTAVYGGRACDADPDVPAPPESGGPYVAVIERGVCTFTEKVANVESVSANGGYLATIIFNREGDCGSFGMTVEGDRPVLSVDRRTGYSFFDIEDQYNEEECLAGDGTQLAPIELGEVGDEVTVEAFFDGWGYVHLYANNGGKMRELDTYAIPEAMDDRYAARFGNLTVHEVATSKRYKRLAYLSYYNAGFRVLNIKFGKLREVGAFIDDDGNDFWGVEAFNRRGTEYVAASDRDYGLYIFRYTGQN